MHARLVLAVLAASSAPASAFGQAAPLVVQPSAEALALARSLGPIGWVQAAPDLGEFTEALTGRLLNTQLAARGPGCEAQDPRCRAAAQRLAREAAPARMAALRAVRVKLVAYMIEDRLKPDEIAAAQAALATPGGAALQQAFAAAADPSRLSPETMQRAQLMMGVETPSETDLLERFYDATRDLPRTQRRIPPPPMPTRKTP